ncbi:MAG: tetratricopeptide repeat protein, partial [Gemmatimonadales bacterium]
MRRSAPAILALLLSSAGLGGCVYYNGMYNTKRLARSAQKAEREGRTFEAVNLWGQVVTRAESLVVRHPDSKYVDEAFVIQGIALANLGQCPNALGRLGRAAVLPEGSEVAEDAALALGRCQLDLGDPASAGVALARVIGSKDLGRRREARLLHARTLRLTGRAEEALPLLDGFKGPRVENERLLALASAGRDAEALALADSLLAAKDTTRQWDTLVVTLGRQRPAVASALVDRLGAQPGVQPTVHARRLLEDGVRLAPVDSARAAGRLREAAKVGAGTDGGDQAELRLIRDDLSRVRDVAGLARPGQALDAIARRRTLVSLEATQLRSLVRRIQSVADSSGPQVPQGDLHLFLAAESSRDSLAAPALAASLFRRIVDQWPDSPYAPKALLAGRQLDPAWADSALAILSERYGE